ncbi:transglycosylase domain-containing protein, partial [Burkholderia stabilis]
MNRPLNRILPRVTGLASVWTWVKWSLLAALVIAVAIVARLVQTEIETSRLQAHYLSELTRDVGYTVETGASDHIRFPANGPYDQRFGYAMIPSFQERLLTRGFVVSQQARDSQRMLSLADRGLFLPYEEKDQTGLMLFDSTGAPLFATVFPQRVYADFDAVPRVVTDSLLFIEDRYLLDANEPNRNPAIDWGRFSRAVADQALHVVNRHQARPGGSTLATQIEKFRHSPEGRTATPPEKLRQIASASVRAYLNGPQTMAARRTIVVRYLNSVPLAARPHIGEITGIGDGVAAWYGRDFNDVNRILSAPTTGDNVDEQGKTFREVLSLIIAQRAPSYFLNRGYPALHGFSKATLLWIAERING